MASRRSSTVFRIAGLPRDRSDEVLESELKDTLGTNFSIEERSQIRIEAVILPSCYAFDRERVALVQFRDGFPQFLSKLIANPLGNLQLILGNTDINLDCHFLGFTQLYGTPNDKPVTAE
jgi:hypothetical protein